MELCNLAVFVPLGLCILNDSAVTPVKPSAEVRWHGLPDEGLFNDGATVNGKANTRPRWHTAAKYYFLFKKFLTNGKRGYIIY